jgi:anti-sigma regulatory factor (Ser/Thr protein kinase)
MSHRGKRIEHGALLSLAIPSDPEFLTVVRSTVARLAEVLGFMPSDCRSVVVAVDEAMTNIIRHAYGSRKDRPINIICRRIHVSSNGKRRAALEIMLVDYGPAVDPTQLSARCLDEIKPGGLGLHFIRECLDVVSYMRSGGENRLRLVKVLP